MKDVVCLTSLFIVISVPISTGSVLDNLHYVGCFDIGFSLNQRYGHQLTPATLGKCVEYCQVLKTRFAGVELSERTCYCGPDIGEGSPRRNDSLCNVECPDDTLRTCGGDWLLSLYDIGRASPTDGADKIDFLMGLSDGIRLYHYNLMNNYDVLKQTSEWVYSVDYHLSKNVLFFHTKQQLFRTSMQQQNKAPVLVKNLTNCEGFAVDWVNDRVFWTFCKSNGSAIVSAGLEGEDEKIILPPSKLGEKVVKRMEVDPYKGIVVWLANGVIQSCDLLGGSFNSNLTAPEMTVRGFALDRRMRRIYYVGAVNQSALYSMDYDGEDKVLITSIAQFRSVYGLSVLGERIFWVNYANVRDILYEAPLNLTRAEDVNMLHIVERGVWHMRVVHPLLQSRPKIHPCEDKNCSYDCAIRSNRKRLWAYCKCPPGQELNSDNVSCHVLEKARLTSSGVAASLVIAVLLIIGVLASALGMVYLLDKYWGLLESKLRDVPYSRNYGKEQQEGTGTSEYHTGEDNVNLI
ncbi:low-density lipoprotein receptor-related protein 4-like [Macrosteles quadrilineatus]|uniref:low-density lipoprotein receptor-related protein 4-like n=1 Tax=Macrosteles quadrilineatus TaxID=74068 RepID=UPI0023E2A92F|nr:low-density lipoprotein receptor-related protein 4-like [Macrosteles quadrilineatus]